MANDFLAFLEDKIVELNTLKAKNNRRFLQERVDKTYEDLSLSEDSLKAFQLRYGAIEITEQARVAIEAAAQIKAELLQAEVARNALILQLSPNHSEIAVLDNQIQALEAKYNELHRSDQVIKPDNDVLFPIDQIPVVGLQYYRLFREVEIQNALLKMLVPLLEQAKIQESKTIPVLRVVDKAVPPTYKFKPKRAIIVIAIVGVSMVFCFLYIFFTEYVRRVRETDSTQHDKLMALKENLKFRKSD
jgi:capsule polysaccharide export protein KpsE/RkpR